MKIENYINISDPFIITFNNGISLTTKELDSNKYYRVEFWNEGNMIYGYDSIESNRWYKPNIKYFTTWHIKIFEIDNSVTKIYSETFGIKNLKNKDVHISIDSKAIGDTLSWMGQISNFKKQTKCKKLSVSTFHVELFDIKKYKKENIHIFQTKYNDWKDFESKADTHIIIGVYNDASKPWDPNKNLRDWRKVPLGRVGADCLGIKYIETKPYINKEYIKKSTKEKSIVIGPESTSQFKHWNNSNGWQKLIDWHVDEGYNVYYAGKKQEHEYKNVITLPSNLKDIAKAMTGCEYVVGLGSGLSWLAWSINVKVILISGFTEEYTEFQDNCVRIINKDVCYGCWNSIGLDKENYNTCPLLENTHRQFECTTSITAEHVIERIKTSKTN